MKIRIHPSLPASYAAQGVKRKKRMGGSYVLRNSPKSVCYKTGRAIGRSAVLLEKGFEAFRERDSVGASIWIGEALNQIPALKFQDVKIFPAKYTKWVGFLEKDFKRIQAIVNRKAKGDLDRAFQSALTTFRWIAHFAGQKCDSIPG